MMRQQGPSFFKKKRFKLRKIFPFWNLIEYGLLRGLIGFLNLLPFPIVYPLARFVGVSLFWLMKRRRFIALHNLEIAFGNSKTESERFRIAKESFQSATLTAVEFFRIPKMIPKVDECFVSVGLENVEKALQRGKGIVFAVSHMGSWEYMSFLSFITGHRTLVVVREIRNPYIYRWVQSLRALMKVIPTDKRNAIRATLAHLKRNEIVAILVDQWAGNEGVWEEFFGSATSTTSLPARYVKHLGCAIVPIYCLRLGGERYQLNYLPEIQITPEDVDFEHRVTQEINRIFEGVISRHPEQWTWFHRRWKERPVTQSASRVQKVR